MALAQSATELANSLTQNEIPIKLRCAICNRLATNAFRLPCCDQSICEPCHSILPESCPVCEHSPLSADDCKPNKALRLTIKAFLKSEEKKRDKSKGSNSTENALQQNEASSKAGSAQNASSIKVETVTTKNIPAESVVADLKNMESRDTTVVQQFQKTTDVEPQNDVAKSNNNQPEAAIKKREIENRDNSHSIGEAENAIAHKQPVNNAGADEETSVHSAYGRHNEAQQGQNEMEWSHLGGFNPMMQMQGNSQNPNWNWMPNMMNVPSMGIDPMAMAQGFFGGFGDQGMGMNGVAAGMNMGDMSLDGGYGGWQCQQAMDMNGNFGANSGYYAGNGYNQQNFQDHSFQRMPYHPDSQSNSFQTKNHFHGHGRAFLTNNSGRGLPHKVRGHVNQRGYYQNRNYGTGNRSAFPHITSSREEEYGAFFHQLPPDLQNGQSKNQVDERAVTNCNQPSSSVIDRNNGEAHAEGVNENYRQENQDHKLNEQVHANPDGSDALPMDEEDHSARVQGQNQSIEPTPSDLDMPQKIPNISDQAMTDVQEDPSNVFSSNVGPFEQQGQWNAATYRGSYRGRRGFYRGRAGRGAFADQQMPYRGRYDQGNTYPNGVNSDEKEKSEPIGQGVEGAPTGPKAMREGIARGGFRGRGVQLSISKRNHPSAGGNEIRERNDHNKRCDYSNPDLRARSRSSSRPRLRHREDGYDEAPRTDNGNQDQTYDDDERYGGRKAYLSDDDEYNRRRRSRSPDTYGRNSKRHSKHHESERNHSSRCEENDGHDVSDQRQVRGLSLSPEEEVDEDRFQKGASDEPSYESSRRRSRVEKPRDHDDYYDNEHGRSSARNRDSGRYRDRRREKEKERDRHQKHEHDRDSDRRRKERKRSRRDRDESPNDQSDEDERRRRRRSKRKKEESYHSHGEYEMDGEEVYDGRNENSGRGHRHTTSRSNHHQQLTQPGPSLPVEDEFKIKDRSKKKPSALATNGGNARPIRSPPTGPAATRRPSGAMSASARSPTHRQQPPTPTSPAMAVDSHTVEREVRDRERLAKEAQRRQQSSRSTKGGPPPHAPTGPAAEKAFAGGSGGVGAGAMAPPTGPSAERRSRGSRRDRRDVDDANEARYGHSRGKRSDGGGGRKKAYRYEDEENDEERATRVESEREAARWR